MKFIVVPDAHGTFAIAEEGKPDVHVASYMTEDLAKGFVFAANLVNAVIDHVQESAEGK